MLGTREPGSQDPLPAPPLLVWAWSLLNPRVTGQVWRKKTTPPPTAVPEGTTSAEGPASLLFSLGNVYFFPGSHPRYTPAARAGFGQEVFVGEKGSRDDMRWLGY